MLAEKAGAKPHCVMGDFDSSRKPEGENTLVFPVEKDDTDTMLCLKRGMAMGFSDFMIIGGFGGRLDHTMANLQTLAYAAKRGAKAEMFDGETWATVLQNGETEIFARKGKLSVFAMDGECRGVFIENAKYTLENAVLNNDFPLGVSNEFLPDKKSARVRVDEGTLLVMITSEQA